MFCTQRPQRAQRFYPPPPPCGVLPLSQREKVGDSVSSSNYSCPRIAQECAPLTRHRWTSVHLLKTLFAPCGRVGEGSIHFLSPSNRPPEDRPESSRFFRLGPREDQGPASGSPKTPTCINNNRHGACHGGCMSMMHSVRIPTRMLCSSYQPCSHRLGEPGVLSSRPS